MTLTEFAQPSASTAARASGSAGRTAAVVAPRGVSSRPQLLLLVDVFGRVIGGSDRPVLVDTELIDTATPALTRPGERSD